MKIDWKKIILAWAPLLIAVGTIIYHAHLDSKEKQAGDIATARRRGVDSVVRAKRWENVDRDLRKIKKKLHIEEDE